MSAGTGTPGARRDPAVERARADTKSRSILPAGSRAAVRERPGFDAPPSFAVSKDWAN